MYFVLLLLFSQLQSPATESAAVRDLSAAGGSSEELSKCMNFGASFFEKKWLPGSYPLLTF